MWRLFARAVSNAGTDEIFSDISKRREARAALYEKRGRCQCLGRLSGYARARRSVDDSNQKRCAAAAAFLRASSARSYLEDDETGKNCGNGVYTSFFCLVSSASSLVFFIVIYSLLQLADAGSQLTGI